MKFFENNSKKFFFTKNSTCYHIDASKSTVFVPFSLISVEMYNENRTNEDRQRFVLRTVYATLCCVVTYLLKTKKRQIESVHCTARRMAH